MSAAALRWIRDTDDRRFEPTAYGAAELQRLHPTLLRRALFLASVSSLLLVLLLQALLPLWREAPPIDIEVPRRTRDPFPPPIPETPTSDVPRVPPSRPPKSGLPVQVPDAPPDTTEFDPQGFDRFDLGPGDGPGTDAKRPGGEGPIGGDPDPEDVPPDVYVEEMPIAVVRVPPEYPELARQAGLEGVVVVQALVGTDGKVRRVRVTKSQPVLDEAALAAVERWIFVPAKTNGRPVAVWVAVPVRFTVR